MRASYSFNAVLFREIADVSNKRQQAGPALVARNMSSGSTATTRCRPHRKEALTEAPIPAPANDTPPFSVTHARRGEVCFKTGRLFEAALRNRESYMSFAKGEESREAWRPTAKGPAVHGLVLLGRLGHCGWVHAVRTRRALESEEREKRAQVVSCCHFYVRHASFDLKAVFFIFIKTFVFGEIPFCNPLSNLRSRPVLLPLKKARTGCTISTAV